MLAQYTLGFTSGILFLIPVLYGINDLPAITESGTNPLFPLADIYLQVTGTPGGSIGLLLLVFLPVLAGSIVGCYLTTSRVFWTLARDRATPWSAFFGHVSPRWKVPANAIVLNSVLCTVLGCIYIGNVSSYSPTSSSSGGLTQKQATAFSAFVSSFVVLTMASYLAAILPHMLSGRSRIRPGPFWMKGAFGYISNSIACVFMLAFIVIFMFPFAMPVTTAYMNYTCVLFGGATIICGACYVVLRKGY